LLDVEVLYLFALADKMNALCTVYTLHSVHTAQCPWQGFLKNGFAKDTSQFETWGEMVMVCKATKF